MIVFARDCVEINIRWGRMVPRGGERPLENIEPLDPRQTLTNTNETLF